MLRLYSMAFAGCMALVETEWAPILNNVRLIDNWVGRGVVQGFLALLTLNLAVNNGDSDFHKSIPLYRRAASASMLACAGLYGVCGLLSFAFSRDAKSRRERSRTKLQADLDELDRQREQVISLIDVYDKA